MQRDFSGYSDCLAEDPVPSELFSAKFPVTGKNTGSFQEFWRIQWLAVDLADALHADESISALVLDRRLRAGIDGEFLRGEELFAIDFAINNPAIDVAL